MQFKIHEINGVEIAEVTSEDVLIKSAQDMLDLMAEISSRVIIIKKEVFNESFFDLNSGLAGEILQKLSNYFMKLGVVGDFSKYSKNFKSFIYESNLSGNIVFVDTTEEAIQKLSR
jgi:hypothetical protein